MVNFRVEEGKLICSFSGSLHTVNCQKIQDELYSKISEFKGPVVFDMAGVKYIASTFLRICTKTFKDVGIENFSVINVDSSVREVFRMVGLDKLLK